MFYCSRGSSQVVRLYGGGNHCIIRHVSSLADQTPIDWFLDETCIPFGQIEDLTVEDSFAVDIPINFPTFRNLRVLKITPWNARFTEGFLRSLHPHPGTEIPSQSLQEITWHAWEGSLGPLVSLVRERKRAGHQLWFVCVVTTDVSYQDLVEELEELQEHVGEVRVWTVTMK